MFHSKPFMLPLGSSPFGVWVLGKGVKNDEKKEWWGSIYLGQVYGYCY